MGVDLDSISLGDEVVELDNTGAIIYMGTSFIALPSFLAELLYVFPKRLIIYESLTNFRNTEIGAKKSWNGRYIIECEKRDGLPNLSFSLAGSNYTIGP